MALVSRCHLFDYILAEPEFTGGKNGVNKFISDSYGYGGYRETEMARDQWKDLTYDKAGWCEIGVSLTQIVRLLSAPWAFEDAHNMLGKKTR